MSDIIKTLEQLNNGAFLEDGNKKFAEVLKAMEDVGGGVGEVTIKLKITRHQDGMANVIPEISAKKPERRRSPSLFFLHEGKLHKEDPKQVPLNLSGTNVRRFGGERE